MSKQLTAGFSVDLALDDLERIYQENRGRKGNIIPVLQQLQETFGYVPEEAVDWMAERMDVPRSTFFGVATFYAQFSFEPKGKNIITVCCGTACHVKGAEKILSRAVNEIGLAAGSSTTEDMNFTLEKVACLGTCSMAPAVLINKKMHGGMSADKVARQINSLKKEAQ